MERKTAIPIGEQKDTAGKRVQPCILIRVTGFDTDIQTKEFPSIEEARDALLQDLISTNHYTETLQDVIDLADSGEIAFSDMEAQTSAENYDFVTWKIVPLGK